MPSSLTFVFIESRFSSIFGDLQDFKKSFASMGVKKMEEYFKILVNPKKGMYLKTFLLTISILRLKII